jgi:hypothetical protein
VQKSAMIDSGASYAEVTVEAELDPEQVRVLRAAILRGHHPET